MGGYGGASERGKSKKYYDTGGNKVKDRNAIAVGEYYIENGHYVAFLQEKKDQKRADLSVDGIHIEVKGMSSNSTDQICKTLGYAFQQVESDNYRYSPETHREGKVVILSKYPNARKAYKTISRGYRKAKKQGLIKGEVLLFHGGKMYSIGGK